MKTYRQRYFSRTLSAVALALTTFTAGPASAAVLKADFNNDGYEDLVVGSPREDVNGHADAGAVSVFYGTSISLPAEPNQQWHQDTPGIGGAPGIAGGAEAYDLFGASIAVGDFNRDGYDDLAIGVPGEDIASSGDAGAVNVIYGSAFGLQLWGNHLLTLSQISSDRAGALFGRSLTVGDFDGDDYDDLAVGIPYYDSGSHKHAGNVAVFFGDRQKLGDYETANRLLHPRQDSDGPYLRAGWSLVSADFDRDGYDDLAIGLPFADVNGVVNAGLVEVRYGRSFLPLEQRFTRLSDDIPHAGARPRENDFFGWSLAAGDFDGNGYPDLAIGHPFEDAGGQDTGAVTIIDGSSSGLGNGLRHYWPANSSILPDKAENYDRFGETLAAADFTGDGIDDLAIGSPFEDQELTLRGDRSDVGQVLMLYGSRTGLQLPTSNNVWHQDRSGVEEERNEGDKFGAALSVGDFNRDNIADLVVGVPGETVYPTNAPYRSNAGMLHIFYGTRLRLSTDSALGRETFTEGLKSTSPSSMENGDQFGSALP
jgi:hypothetical protein